MPNRSSWKRKFSPSSRKLKYRNSRLRILKSSSRKRTSTFILKNSPLMLSVNWCRPSMWMPRISPAESGCSTSISSTMGWGTSLWMNWKQKKRRDRSHAKSSPFRELLQILFYGNSATGNALLYISLLSVALIASFTSSAILNNLFAICNSRLLPTNQIVNCDGRVRPQGRTLFLFCI